MPNERLIPTPDSISVITSTILSNGNVVPGQVQVLSIVVQTSVNRIPQATLVIRDGDAASQTFPASEADYFLPGREIVIKAGYRANEDTIFRGVVVSQSLKMREQKSILRVVCKAPAYKMTMKTKGRYFRDQTDSDIMETIINEYGLSPDVDTTQETLGQMVQYQSSDWDFLITRAEANGMICLVDNTNIRIRKPDLQAPIDLTLLYGATLFELDLEMDARTQYKAITSQAWSIADQSVLETEESIYTVPAAGNLTPEDLADVHGADNWVQRHSGNISQAELQSWTEGRILKSRLAKIRGRGKFQGIASILPGQVVKLDGVGQRFQGNLFVSGVRHELADGSWKTDAEFGLDPSWFVQQYEVPQPQAGALLPPVSGLQIGVVTQLQDDPNSEFRIMVRLPLVDSADSGAWARVARLDAGDQRGSIFLPEIGDEVLVGFLNDDPRHPVVLGAFNSSAKQAPLAPSDDNHEKGFVTRSGSRVLFNDEHKNITIDTADGNSIVLSGEEQAITIKDQHGNQLVMDSNGISLESIGEISLKANTNLNAEGANVEIKGSASTKVSSSGSLTIQGSLVQIN